MYTYHTFHISYMLHTFYISYMLYIIIYVYTSYVQSTAVVLWLLNHCTGGPNLLCSRGSTCVPCGNTKSMQHTSTRDDLRWLFEWSPMKTWYLGHHWWSKTTPFRVNGNVMSQNGSYNSAHWLNIGMGRSQNWPDLRSQIWTIKDVQLVQVVETVGLIKV